MTLPRPDVARPADWEALAAFHEQDRPGWERRVFSTPYARSRDWVHERMAAAGLDVTRDAVGNLIGGLPGTGAGLPALVTGSHTDTVAGGGRFDGIIGVLGAIEAVRLLAVLDRPLRHPLRVVDFLGEEANDFGLSCVGSRAVAGELTSAHLELTDATGGTLAQQLAWHTGGSGDDAHTAAWDPDDVAAFVELHIEQGRRLEDAGVPIGIVSAIAGIHRFAAVVRGRPDHAGTATMADRRDALAAASELVLAVEGMARDAGGDAVATTGRLALEPGSINVVPGTTRLWGEFRSTDFGWLADLDAELSARAARVAERRGVDVDVTWTAAGRPVPTAPEVRDVIATAAGDADADALVVPSGAGHDAAFMARLAPIGVVFVPSRDGRSHCPEEWTDLDQVAVGVAVLAATLLRLDALLDDDT